MTTSAVLSDSAHVEAGEPARRDRLRLILVLGALVALGPLTIDMYLPAFPAITADLLTSSAMVQLTLTGTLIGLGAGQLVIGPLSDALGRRAPLIAGTIVHVAASLLCIIAPNIAVLGALRTVQGFGAAATMVVALAIVRDLFTGTAAATVLSRLMLVMGAAPIFAPALGSAVLVAGSWRWVFAALAGLGFLLLILAIVALKETLPPERRRPARIVPVLQTYKTILRDKQFLVLAFVAAAGMSALFSYIAGASFVLQEGYGLNEQQFALVFAVGAVALIGASQMNVPLLSRFSPRQIVLAGLTGASFSGAVMLALAVTQTGGLLGFIVPLLFVLAAVGFVLPNAPALALSRHGEAAGTAAALLGAAQFGLGALVAPVVGVLGNDARAMAITMTSGSVLALIALSAVMARSRVN
ncbi:multidrug effflux MFS transporter [Hoyosella altamirensis]|uniref:DHA1 family bicyclomycin/chloramphenicol resistance-like MFS transporter n=1 Tax=Hoyosella altamirensis TaxID=616997 RepID=A0A839RKZ5_9ACTN|nr:multidrug effflux MFS transporter [Hoyosella altamirensis]MBB3036733.1 DHA1 family bicyclomycin/chloramphenicol resistance-like MFS transporter [Hoyosella altamirensis]